MASGSIALPGQFLGATSSYVAGAGTHLDNGNIYASILGIVAEADTQQANGLQSSLSRQRKQTRALPTLSISRSISASPATVLPTVDAIVLARVTRTSTRQANVTILVVGNTVCAEGFAGLIRVQDVRSTEKDRVKISESFRPGDVVRAVVISLGDQSNYYLSTAGNELGVIVAKSEAGNAMVPMSWKEFWDPVAGVGEARKVAKPF